MQKFKFIFHKAPAFDKRIFFPSFGAFFHYFMQNEHASEPKSKKNEKHRERERKSDSDADNAQNALFHTYYNIIYYYHHTRYHFIITNHNV